MRIGIIAEGRADLAVISNILKGTLSIDEEAIEFIRPEYYLDETDLHQQRPAQFGNCSLVREECLSRKRIRDFLESPIDEGVRLVVIHVDTAEIGRSDSVLSVVRPAKPTVQTKPKKKRLSRAEEAPIDRPLGASLTDYAKAFRAAVAGEIVDWLDGEFVDRSCFAIAVEELEAWILTLSGQQDTCGLSDPKKHLLRWLNESNRMSDRTRKRFFQMSEFQQYDELSKPFRQKTKLRDAAARNASLAAFVESLDEHAV